MKIAVIGTGNVGSALGGTLARAGHEVTFAARDVEKADRTATSIGATSSSTTDAVAAADIVVLAVPFGALADVADDIRPVADGKIVVDATNPLKPDYSGLALQGTSAAEELARLLPDAKVAKAFNTVFASNQADPDGQGETLDGLFATDDEATRATLAELIESIGFRPVHVGPLSAARELEAMAWLNIRLQMLNGGDWRSAFVVVGAPAPATAQPALSAR
jgi:NADPH-dependent F420 reductase